MKFWKAASLPAAFILLAAWCGQARGQAPAVALTGPANGQRFAACSDIPVSVSVTAGASEITKVELTQNGTLVKSWTRMPYDITRKGLPGGRYEFVARVLDKSGAVTVSDTVVAFVGSAGPQDRVLNGEFDCAAWPWRLDQYEGASASLEIVPDLWLTPDSSGARITIADPGAQTWGVQLMQPFVLRAGHVYEVSFTGFAEQSKDIELTFSQDYSPWGPHWSQPVTVFDPLEYGPFTFECGVDDPKVMFKFVVGGNTIPLALDAVRVVDRTAAAVRPAPGPAGFALHPNHPNPFNPATTLPFEIPAAGRVRLAVFDALGRVAASFERDLGPGAHAFTWDGSDGSGRPAKSGVYVARLAFGGRSLSRKMLLVK